MRLSLLDIHIVYIFWRLGGGGLKSDELDYERIAFQKQLFAFKRVIGEMEINISLS